MAVLLVMLAALAAGAVIALLVRAGRRESRAEAVRLAEDARREARRSLEAVWTMDDREFEDYIAGLCRRDGCTGVQRVGGAGDLGADVIGYLPDVHDRFGEVGQPTGVIAMQVRQQDVPHILGPVTEPGKGLTGRPTAAP